MEFYKMAYEIQSNYRNYERTKGKLAVIYPELKYKSKEQFYNDCQAYFPIIRGEIHHQEVFQNDISINSEQESPHNINDFFYNNLPENGKRKLGPWSAEETQALERLIYDGIYNKCDYITADGTVHWGLLSLMIPGRTGRQCKAKYKKMVKKGKIPEIKDIPTSDNLPKFLAFSQNALLPEQEEQLITKIREMIESKQEVTSRLIRQLARDLYNNESHLARKAAINYCIDLNEPYLNDKNLFSDLCNQKYEELYELALVEPQQIVNQYSVPVFKASRTWAFNFMRKHNLVYRRTHYARRGAIDEVKANEFLQHLSDAISRYGPSRVLNMDETQVLLNNFNKKTIAIKGQKTVTVEKDFVDLKAGTTYIGTISMDPTQKFPLYCIAKGLSPVCEEKYGNEMFTDKCVMDHSKSGWCTVDVMQRYLNWISLVMNKEPFALVLDIYRTHITQDVKNLAAKLNIELVYVPANGTGTYQPLDRTIFGIVKQKLSSQEYSLIDVGNIKRAEMFGVMHQRMIKAWQAISQSAIKVAWNIPDLDFPVELMQDSDSHEENP
ncbi:hypothetical protein IKO50_05835 [bacterium]|nr:hypothetical protein [bacterium]